MRGFIHTCNTQRATATTDVYRNKKRSYTSQLTAQPCRLVINTEAKIMDVTAELVIVDKYKLFLPFSADVLAGDRVTSVTLEDGTVVSETLDVYAILPRRGASIRHKTAILKKVK
jgi:hypothetical protein